MNLYGVNIEILVRNIIMNGYGKQECSAEGGRCGETERQSADPWSLGTPRAATPAITVSQ